jgi:hypothetical protein
MDGVAVVGSLRGEDASPGKPRRMQLFADCRKMRIGVPERGRPGRGRTLSVR